MLIFTKIENGILHEAEVNENAMTAKVEVHGTSKIDKKKDSFIFDTKEAMVKFIDFELKRKGYELTEKR